MSRPKKARPTVIEKKAPKDGPTFKKKLTVRIKIDATIDFSEFDAIFNGNLNGAMLQAVPVMFNCSKDQQVYVRDSHYNVTYNPHEPKRKKG
jgi:hypothetical protein